MAEHNKNILHFSSGVQKSEIETPARLLPSGGSEEVSIPCLASSFWWLSAISGVLWLVDASLQSLLPFHIVFSMFLLSLARTPPLNLGSTVIHYDLIAIFTLIIFAEILFLIFWMNAHFRRTLFNPQLILTRK